jgi:mannose/fructose/N-acetylgalactosamine-specific phosphotransferase system component IIB
VTIVLARVDDRLVHGQVMEAWVPCLRADAVVIADDQAWGDPARRRLLECLDCADVEVSVFPLLGLVPALAAREGKRVIVLFASLESASAAIEGGLALPVLNVGNLHHPGFVCCQVAPSIFLDERDLRLVESLRARGVRVEGRDVPEGMPVELAASAAEGSSGG